MRWNPLMVIVLLAWLWSPAAAQMEDEQALEELKLTIRTYNVSDLLRVARNYPLDPRTELPVGAPAGRRAVGGGGGMTGMFEGGAFMGAPEMPAQRPLDPLSSLLVELIDPASWAENGGDIGLIRTFDSVLVIRQTPQNHQLIEHLLAEIRKTSAPAQVMAVRAHWVMLAEGENPEPGTEVSTEWLAAQQAYSDARTVCFSGQTVHVTSGRGRTVISNLTPVVSENSAAYDPDAQLVQSGVSLQVAPQLVPGTDGAIVDVHSYSVEWHQPGDPAELKLAVANLQHDAVNTVDRVALVAQQIKTTLRVPLGKPVVVGGMTFDPAADDERRQLCLIIEVNALK